MKIILDTESEYADVHSASHFHKRFGWMQIDISTYTSNEKQNALNSPHGTWNEFTCNLSNGNDNFTRYYYRHNHSRDKNM